MAFEPHDVLTVSDLLLIGPASKIRWDRAQPGIAVVQRLVSLLLEKRLTIESLLAAGQDDIGEENGSLCELPPSPQEPKSDMASSTGRQARRFLAGVVRWLTQRVPATSDEPTWVNRLEQWAEKHLADYRAGCNASRNKEITRLLHLLESPV